MQLAPSRWPGITDDGHFWITVRCEAQVDVVRTAHVFQIACINGAVTYFAHAYLHFEHFYHFFSTRPLHNRVNRPYIRLTHWTYDVIAANKFEAFFVYVCGFGCTAQSLLFGYRRTSFGDGRFKFIRDRHNRVADLHTHICAYAGRVKSLIAKINISDSSTSGTHSHSACSHFRCCVSSTTTRIFPLSLYV